MSANAIATSDDKPDAIEKEISTRSTQLRRLEAKVATLEASLGRVDTELKRLEHEAMGWLERLHDTLDGELTESAKEMLAELVDPDDKLNFIPENGRFRVRGRLVAPVCSVPSGI